MTVNVTLLGGGFGRKSKCDFAIEAALLSKAIECPRQTQRPWKTHVRNGFLHTVSAERIEAGLDKSGKVVAWRHRSVAPSIASNLFAPTRCIRRRSNSAWGLIDMPFEIANIQCESPEAAAHTRTC